MGLLRGVARTAVVAGTATAVSGRVQRRQAMKFADQDAQTAARQQEAYQAQMASSQPPAAAPGGISTEALERLKELGALKEQGILTEQEFQAQKAKVLGN